MNLLKIYSLLSLSLIGFIANAQEPRLILPLGHTDVINNASFSPDGKRIVTTSKDYTAKIWDVKTGYLMCNLIGSNSNVESIGFSPDGKRILTLSSDELLKIWDPINGHLISQFGDTTSSKQTILIYDSLGRRKGLLDAMYSPNGKKILSVDGFKGFKLWDVNNNKLIASVKAHSRFITSAEFSPDNKYILTISEDDSTAKIWNTTNGKLLMVYRGHKDKITSGHFCLDGKSVLTTSLDSTIKIWKVNNGEIVKSFKETAGVKFAILSKNNIISILTNRSFNDKKIPTLFKIWNTITDKCIKEFNTSNSICDFANFSPDGKKIIYSINNKDIIILDEKNNRTTLKDCKEPVFSPQGEVLSLITSDNKLCKIYNFKQNKFLNQLSNHVSPFIINTKFSYNSNLLAIVCHQYKNSSVSIFDLNKATISSRLSPLKNNLMDCAFFPGDNELVINSNYLYDIWDLRSKKIINEFINFESSNYETTNITKDGNAIIRKSGDEEVLFDIKSGKKLSDNSNFKKFMISDLDSIMIWNADTTKLLKNLGLLTIKKIDTNNFSNNLSYSLLNHVFSPSFKYLAIFINNQAEIWDYENQKRINILNEPSAITGLSFSPDDKILFVTANDNNSYLYKINNNFKLHVLKGINSSITKSIFSNDSKNIVSIGNDNSIQFWNTLDAKLIYTINLIDSSDYLITDQDNHYDGTEAARKLLYFTCGTEVISLDQVKDQLWVPNLAERIMKGETINAPKLSDLDICNLTPQVEEIETKTASAGYHFKITPRRGGLGETVLYVNDIEVKRYKPLQLIKAGANYNLNLSQKELQQYFVLGQQNTVTVKSFTAKNDIASRGAKVTNTDTSKINSTPPNLYAVMVGVSDYKGGDLNLKYAAKDATDLSAAIGSSARKLLNADGKEHVFTYNLTTNKDHYLLPEKKAIQQTLTEIGKKSAPNDILLVFFAGHGVTKGEKKKFYFLTSDASSSTATAAPETVGISTSELTEWIQPSKIKAQKRILILDACNSGQAINDLVKIGDKQQNYVAARNDDKAEQIKAIDKLNERSGMFILAASASNQSAYEMGRYNQGLLTYALLKVMKEQPNILEDGKYLNVSRWFNAAEKTVTDIMSETGNRQQPQITSTTNFNIGIVDNEVASNIKLPVEKTTFKASVFLNADENINDDNLQISELVNQNLSDISNRGINSTISYIMGSNSPDAYSLSGRYIIKDNTITVKINIKQSNQIKQKFEITGSKDQIKELSKQIAEKATQLIKE